MIALKQVTVSASTLTGFREFVSARGVVYANLLERSGLSPHELDDPDAALPFNAVAALMENAAEETGDTCLGLAFAECYPKGASGVLGYLIMHAETMQDAVRTIEHYASLVLHSVPMEVQEEPDVTTLSWRFPVHLTARRRQFSNFCVATMVLRLRHLAGGDWNPRLVELEHRAPACNAIVQRVLGPHVTFNADRNCIVMDNRSLRRRSEGADPRLYTILKKAGDARLNELAIRPDIVARTARVISETLNSEPPLLENIAEKLRLTPRALQNRLSQHGTTFERVLSETRRALAERYLRDTDLSLTEIGFLLGFSEQSAFTRAARGWFGRPPRAMRNEARRTASGPSTRRR
jgi:AraC-like DNA-binding protein